MCNKTCSEIKDLDISGRPGGIIQLRFFSSSSACESGGRILDQEMKQIERHSKRGDADVKHKCIVP